MSIEGLRPYATPRQLEYLDAVEKHGSNRAAAKALGVVHSTVDRAVAAVKVRAASFGWSPQHDMTHTAPDGFTVKGVSTFYPPPEPGMPGQWVKIEQDRQRQLELMREVAASMSEDIKREPVTKRRQLSTNADLLNLYAITDYHLGMYAWSEETGADWDMDLAENLLVSWFAQAVESSPDASTGLLGLMGDLIHWDGMEALTPAAGNVLDADTRFEKLVRVVIRVIRRVVRMLLAKHERLHIVIAEGNHDPASSAWLREWFAVLYEDEPRVTVDTSPSPYYAYEHGSTLIGIHHGHKRKVQQLDHVFAGKFREEYGRTKHCYIHSGHLHSAQMKESNLAIVEQHRTLAAPDAYSARGGWLSGRSASVITYSKLNGEVGRVTISPEMCQAVEEEKKKPCKRRQSRASADNSHARKAKR